MADQVTLTINGKQVQAPTGELLIETCKRLASEIPAFCYYEGMSLQAACRMCLVEVEKFPKLQTACTLPVAEGMVVQTESDAVVKARKTTLEFLLSNHPLDCPVCDKGGECELQDMVFRYGVGESRYTEVKQHVPEKQWSPVVFYDSPRCILCYRCIRVCDEGMGVGALGLTNRGIYSEITPSHGDHLECDECGACIDICPVGALTSGAYRYKTRPWEMEHTGTICTHCGDGCKTTLGTRGDEIVRANNRDRSGINEEFLCVKGRYAFDFNHHAERLQSPMIRMNGELQPVSWTEALKAVAAQFTSVKAAGGSIGVIGSTRNSNEENFLLQKFARQVLGTSNIDHPRSGDIVTLLDALSGKTDALASVDDLYKANGVLILGSDLSQQHPLLANQIRANVRHHKAKVFTVTRGPVREDDTAAVAVRASEGQEVSALEGLKDKLAATGDLIILIGASVKGEAVRKLVAFGDTLGIPVKYICLMDASNSRGAVDMGVTPDLYPGYKPVEKPGKSMANMLADPALGMLWVIGENPLAHTKLASTNAFVVVQDMFLTETAQRADVVLPSASGYEKNGTITNTTGQVQRLKKAVEMMGTKTDLAILGLLARAMGADATSKMGASNVDAVFEEIRSTIRGYNVALPVLMTGGAAQTMPVNGRVPVFVEIDSIRTTGDTLFTSGTLGRYSKTLNAVMEAPGKLYGQPVSKG